MKACNIGGALVSPISMTRYSEEPIVFGRPSSLMAGCDANIVVASVEVELGVNLCAAELVEEVCDEWDWVPILPSDLVEVSEVNTESQDTIILLGKETRCAHW